MRQLRGGIDACDECRWHRPRRKGWKCGLPKNRPMCGWHNGWATQWESKVKGKPQKSAIITTPFPTAADICRELGLTKAQAAKADKLLDRVLREGGWPVRVVVLNDDLPCLCEHCGKAFKSASAALKHRDKCKKKPKAGRVVICKRGADPFITEVLAGPGYAKSRHGAKSKAVAKMRRTR